MFAAVALLWLLFWLLFWFCFFCGIGGLCCLLFCVVFGCCFWLFWFVILRLLVFVYSVVKYWLLVWAMLCGFVWFVVLGVLRWRDVELRCFVFVLILLVVCEFCGNWLFVFVNLISFVEFTMFVLCDCLCFLNLFIWSDSLILSGLWCWIRLCRLISLMVLL